MSSSDLQVIFPAIIFITLVVVLSSFFVVSNDGFSFAGYSDDPNVPYGGVWVNENGSSYDGSTVEVDEGDESQFLASAAVFIGSLFLTFATLGTSWFITVPLVITTGASLLSTIDSLPNFNVVDALKNVPGIGALVDVLDHVTSMLVSFWSVLSWSPKEFGGLPLIGVVIIAPLSIFFFIFLMRFIRGQ